MKVLIIVDMQKGFINNNNKFLIENIENLLDNAGGGFDKVISTKFVNHSSSQYVKHLNWNKMQRSGLSEFAIDLPKDVKIIEKETYGLKDRMFSGSIFKLGKNIFTADKDEIYICGTDYDACVLAIGYQFFDHGFQPHFIMDCVGSAAKNPNISPIQFQRQCQRIFGKNSILKSKVFYDKFSKPIFPK